MTLAATVLIPTHDHGPTLRYSVASALRQTEEEIEVFVIGDGAPDVTRDIMADFARRDGRVRFFDHPKGPRHGELYRHAALAEARGEIACYLADDDLYLPHHVGTMRELLRAADFANTACCPFERGGRLEELAVDLERPYYRELLLSGINRIPLSCGAHTMALYRRLPHGWRTTPKPTPTDLYMWQQILSAQGCRAMSSDVLTVLHFPSASRPDVPIEARVAELEDWRRRTMEPGFRGRLEAERRAFAHRRRVRLDEEYERLREEYERVQQTPWMRLKRRLLAVPLLGPALRRGNRWMAR